MKYVENIKEPILFECKYGSFLYGTNSPLSDTDIKGVFLPSREDLILQKAPKHYTFTTGASNSRNTKDDIDSTYYSLHYFLELASRGDTNAIDMLFAYTNKDAVTYIDPLWSQIVENIPNIINRNTKAFMGYCKGQCIKYSVKGDKLNNFRNFKDFLTKYIDAKGENGEHISLHFALYKDFFNRMSVKYPEPGADRIKIDDQEMVKLFGEHVYLCTALNKEQYISISDIKFALSENIVAALHKINRTIASYGQRAETAAEHNGADMKALSHCVRVLFEVEQLLTEGKVTFPLKEAEFVKSIKYNTSNLSFDDIMDWINTKINYIEQQVFPNTKLPESSNHKWIDKFILNCYQ